MSCLIAHCQLFCLNEMLLFEKTLYLNSGPSRQNQERRAALTETALKNPVLFSGPRGGRFEKICCIGSTSNPSATVGPGVRGCACPGLFPRMSTSCLMVEQPACACGDGCSWMFAGIVFGQIRPGRVRGCQFTTLPRPPMRGSIIAQTSSTIMPQPVWTLYCILLGG